MIVIGIDPGTHNFGLGILHIDDELKLTEAVPICINADALLANTISVTSDDFEDRHNVLIKYMDLIIASLDDEIVAFVYEIPHFDRDKPQSYAVLMNHIYQLESHLKNTYKVSVRGYRPTSIKAVIGANKKLKGEKAKDAVLRCMKDNTELVDAISYELENYTDDAIDSVLIGFKFITEARDYL